MRQRIEPKARENLHGKIMLLEVFVTDQKKLLLMIKEKCQEMPRRISTMEEKTE
jgi:hypothetical protein